MKTPVTKNPIEKIIEDRQVARSHHDSNADICFLALASNNEPSVRTLVLRDISMEGFTLFINKTSEKWRIAEQNPAASMLLWYHATQRQYRITGHLEEQDRSVIAGNWHRRPAGSKYLDQAYERLGAQSSAIPSRDTLVEFIRDLRQTLPEEDLETPPSAAGIILKPKTIEILDLNQQDRIHDRCRFELTEAGWQTTQLIP